jgi:hypothetical protein
MNTRSHPARGLAARFLATLPAVILLAGGSGCATFNEPPARLVIPVVNPDCFLVQERETNRNGLLRAVRRTGADVETEIHLQLGQGQTPGLLGGAYALLQNAGYHKVFFTTKREAIATIVTEPPAPTAAPAAPPRKILRRP